MITRKTIQIEISYETQTEMNLAINKIREHMRSGLRSYNNRLKGKGYYRYTHDSLKPKNQENCRIEKINGETVLIIPSKMNQL